MHKAQQRVAVGNLQHIIAIFQHGIGRDQSKTGLDPRPILGIGFGVVERIGLFEEVTRRTKAVLFNDVIVVLRTVGASSGGPCHTHILAFEIAVELFTEMHVAHQLRANMPGRLVRIENTLGGHLRTRGVGAICRGKIEILQFVCGFVCVGDAGFRQWRIRPAL